MNEELKKDCKELEGKIADLLYAFYQKHDINISVQSSTIFRQTKCEMMHMGFQVNATLHP